MLRAGMTDPLFDLQTDDGPLAVAALQDLPAVVETAMFGRSVHIAMHELDGAREAIEARLAERGLAVNALNQISPSLEDAFVALVRAAGGAPVG